MRDTELGICHKFNHKKPLPSHAEGSWEAQVLAAWDTVAARFWEPQATGATQRKRPASDEGSSSQRRLRLDKELALTTPRFTQHLQPLGRTRRGHEVAGAAHGPNDRPSNLVA